MALLKETQAEKRKMNKCLELHELSKSNKKLLPKTESIVEQKSRDEPKKLNSARKPLGQQKSIQDSIDRMIKARLVIPAITK